MLSSHCKEFKYLKDDVLAKVNALGYLTKKPEEPAPDDAPQTTRVSLQRIDLLLNWTRNSHYLMHKDSIDSHGMCYLTVIVNITPYASTLLVAGAKTRFRSTPSGKDVRFRENCSTGPEKLVVERSSWHSSSATPRTPRCAAQPSLRTR